MYMGYNLVLSMIFIQRVNLYRNYAIFLEIRISQTDSLFLASLSAI